MDAADESLISAATEMGPFQKKIIVLLLLLLLLLLRYRKKEIEREIKEKEVGTEYPFDLFFFFKLISNTERLLNAK